MVRIVYSVWIYTVQCCAHFFLSYDYLKMDLHLNPHRGHHHAQIKESDDTEKGDSEWGGLRGGGGYVTTTLILSLASRIAIQATPQCNDRPRLMLLSIMTEHKWCSWYCVLSPLELIYHKTICITGEKHLVIEREKNRVNIYASSFSINLIPFLMKKGISRFCTGVVTIKRAR